MQPNTATTTENNIERIQQIIKKKFKEEGQCLSLCRIGVHLDGCENDWRNVLEFRNWTALHTLELGNTAITQRAVKLMTRC